MPNHVPAPELVPAANGPPWTATDTLYFSSGALSNFALTPGLRLPHGYRNHRELDTIAVVTVEHWFQACKATSRREFELILSASTAAAAKRAGRHTQLRDDWEHIKYQVMLVGLRGKFGLEPYRSLLLLTGRRPLAEDSRRDFIWGCRDPHGGHTGQNLLGRALMQIRAELARRVLTDLADLGIRETCP